MTTTTTAPPALDHTAVPPSRLQRRVGHLRTPAFIPGYFAAKVIRRSYGARLDRLAPLDGPPVDVTMWSFSSHRDLAEQVASIRSFLRHVGAPTRWTIVSDGSHDERDRALLRRQHACIELCAWEDIVTDPHPAILDCAKGHPLGRKLGLLVDVPVDGPTLIADSDILFLRGARALPGILAEHAPRPAYQLDCFNVLAPDLVDPASAMAPTNTGIVLLHSPLDWSAALAALSGIDDLSGRFARGAAWMEQATAHRAMADSGGRPFDADRFIIHGEDRLAFRERRPGPDAVLRHYAGPTRHLMWARVASDALRRSVRR